MARKKKKTPVVSYGNVVPQVFGTAGDAIEQYVTFGIGTIDKIVSGSNTSVGLIAFGYDSELKSGAIAIGGELVSSKILDISIEDSSNDAVSTITVKYLDSSTVQELTFNTIDPSIIEMLDSSLSELYQEIIMNEEIIHNYFEVLNTSINILEENQDIINTSINILEGNQDIINTSINLLEDSKNTINTSINILEDNYVKEITVINSSALVVNNITPTGTKGKQYEIGLVVDDNTVKIENGQLTAYGNTYTIKATSIPTDGFLKTYQLYQTNAAGVETAVTDAKIDIPKDFVLKEAHLCKVTTEIVDDEIIYTETAKATDSDFDTAQGEIYLHFIWHTKDVSTMTSETFIKVTDFAALYTGDADTEPSTGKYITITSSNVVSMDSSKLWNDLIEPLDTSMKDIYKQLIDDEEVLVNYFVLLDTSINKNTLDISILYNSINNIEDISILNSSVSNIEANFVQNVNATVENASLAIRNTYTPTYQDAVQVPEVQIADSSISYTITKTINGVNTDVVTINTVNPNLINEIATILTDHSERMDTTEHTLKWITI